MVKSHEFIGAIEAGGSKFICSVGRSWQEIYESEKYVVTTTTPDQTMTRVLDWFDLRHKETPIRAFGIASFGPVDFDTKSIALTTPKKPWRGFDWQTSIDERFTGVPIGFETDTNAAGIAEWRWGNAIGKSVAAYVTIGTGIGGGLIVEGVPVHGLLHPELGHMRVPRQDRDDFTGVCPAHGECLEGLASGKAVNSRLHRGRTKFPRNHEVWQLESDYLSHAMVNIITITSPEVIVLGGGVMAVEGLLEQVQRKTESLLAGYIAKDELGIGIGNYIVAPSLGRSAGVIGAFAVGLDALSAVQ